MSRVVNPSRRMFVAGVGAASIAGWAQAAQSKSSDYLLPPGVIHLNTASLGATPRAVLL